MTRTSHEFRISKNAGEITPDEIGAADLGQFLIHFEKFIAGSGTAQINLVEIKNKCVSLNFQSPPQLDPQWGDLGCLNSGLNAYSGERAKNYKAIERFLHRNNCYGEIFKNGENIGTMTPTKPLAVETSKLSEMTSLYGKVLRVGGEKKPKVEIQHHQGYAVRCDADKQMAIEMAARLYSEVGVRGKAERDLSSGKIVKFEIRKLLEYRKTAPVDAFSVMQEQFGQTFYGIDDQVFRGLRE